ncbi:GNAT family N-acetyltransferase [Elioraea sp.]|uniref:GNAT family N-acetyltransferase n=1 Tax=Elioraea sp. TaxID=2185103 RepID=UPI0025C14C72|nr:GNAT family N-acetyltransferase [Elioraea sp.]
MTTAGVIRPGRDSDAAGFISLIGACWGEYPGCVLDVDNEAPELRALATHVAGRGGALWAAEVSGAVVGMIAAVPLNHDQAWEISRMYVAQSHRGTGLANELLRKAEGHARAAGAKRMVLWTDTRFEAAHKFYEKNSYVRAGSIRVLDDRSRSLEFRYAKPITGTVVEVLDPAAAVSAERRLAEVLKACVDDGAVVGFLAPLPIEKARAFWRERGSEVAAAKRVILASWVDGEIGGCLQLDLDVPENQTHRAEVRQLLVHPEFRRRGVGRELMARIDQAALAHGRRILVLRTWPGGPAETIVRSLGWAFVGVIPGYAIRPTGEPVDEGYWWKRIE